MNLRNSESADVHIDAIILRMARTGLARQRDLDALVPYIRNLRQLSSTSFTPVYHQSKNEASDDL